MSDGFANVEAARLWYERAGEGFPVVLIHPWLWDSRLWDDQFQEFSKYHDVVRYDLRGHGRSEEPAAPYSDLRDLESLIGELDIDRCALVGCATGAQLAIDCALAHPELVDAIVLASPAVSGYDWPATGMEALTKEVEDAVAGGDLAAAMEVELAVWAPIASADPRVREIALDNAEVLRIEADLLEPVPPAVDRLGELQAATLVVVGDRDLVEIHEVGDLIVDRVPGATKRVIAEADQLVNVAKPEKFNRLVLDFLAFRM
jgi:pimeloyl-ACP methyl ester carboxylesterase